MARLTGAVAGSDYTALVWLVQETSGAAVDRAVKRLDRCSREAVSAEESHRYHIAAATLRETRKEMAD